ncbi:3'-5' exonuclease [Streptomyces decoyicus]|uniref:3'-5' exonuclease n=1 Tax=Streptomyces decoyicus TaxID=249567 RepID=UPI0033D2936F
MSARTALIVGASRNLGLGLATEYAHRGWDVIGTVRGSRRTALHDLAEASRGRVVVESLDTTKQLMLFTSWGDLQDYASYDPAGHDLQPLVDLVDKHGTDVILAAVNQLTDEDQAHVTVSTAHKAKGREWPRVRIAGDFLPPRDSNQQDNLGRPIPAPIDDAEARLAYVAVTRTRNRLDIGGLSWLDQHPDGTSPANPPSLDP